MYLKLVKSLFDVLVALLLLIILSPVFLLTILLLATTNRGEIFFTQLRPGKGERVFRLIKFKTMNDDRDEFGVLRTDEYRMTGVGKWVRKVSIDELPQLINVLKGEMSLVGPRPLLVEYLPLYDQKQKKRHDVKPGITGWAQVNGRNAIGWQRRFEFDVWYVDHVSFWLDLKIILLTLIKVFKAEGISSETSATMEKFNGNG